MATASTLFRSYQRAPTDVVITRAGIDDHRGLAGKKADVVFGVRLKAVRQSEQFGLTVKLQSGADDDRTARLEQAPLGHRL